MTKPPWSGKPPKVLLNEALSLISYLLNNPKPYSYPIVSCIETTTNCNLECSMCPRKYMTRPKGTMKLDLFKSIIKDLKGYTPYLGLQAMGEPLLDPYLLDRLTYCTLRRIKTGISTNATFLDESTSIELIYSGLSLIVLCLDGLDKDTYESIRRGANFLKVKTNIENFLKLNNNKIYTIVQLIDLISNKNNLDNLKTLGADEVLLKRLNDFAGTLKIENPITEKRHPCVTLWHSLIILWDGRVVPCCRDFDAKEVLGEVTKNSLKEIWLGDKLVNLRKAHLRGDFTNDLCSTCTDYPKVTLTRILDHLKGGLNSQRSLNT